MTALADAKFDALRGLGYTGAVNDMMVQFLQGKGATSDSLPDAWREFLDLVVVPPTGQYNDDWNTYLGDQGHTGALNDRELAFWISQGVNLGADLVVNGTFDTDFSNWSSGQFAFSAAVGNPSGSALTFVAGSMTQSIPTIASATTYRVRLDAGSNAGVVSVTLGGTVGATTLTGNGSLLVDIVAGASNTNLVISSTSSVWVDNITCQEIL